MLEGLPADRSPVKTLPPAAIQREKFLVGDACKAVAEEPEAVEVHHNVAETLQSLWSV